MRYFLIKNVDNLPVGPQYKNAGQVLPFYTIEVDGEIYPAAFTEDLASHWDENERVELVDGEKAYDFQKKCFV